VLLNQAKLQELHDIVSQKDREMQQLQAKNDALKLHIVFKLRESDNRMRESES